MCWVPSLLVNRSPGRLCVLSGLFTNCSSCLRLPLKTASCTAPSFNDEQALSRCAAGDRQALQDIYQQESRRLLGEAMQIARQRQQAEDILHDRQYRLIRLLPLCTAVKTLNATLVGGTAGNCGAAWRVAALLLRPCWLL